MKTILLAAALIAAAPATAGTLFQSLPDLTVDPVVAGYCSSCNSFLQFRLYDGFTLARDSTINSVTFAVDNFTPITSINVGFFNRAGGLPGTAIANYNFTPAQFVSSVVVPSASERIRSLVTVSLPGLALGAGSYDLSLFNASGLSIPAYANPGGSLYQSGNFFSPSQTYADRSLAFSLGGTVPEPATWALMIGGFGLTGLAMRRRVALAA